MGTLVVNLSGSFLLGILFALVIERSTLPSDIRAPVMIGFIGAYTTFSTWMLESARLMEDGAWLLAAANLGGSVLLGLLAIRGARPHASTDREHRCGACRACLWNPAGK